MSITAKDSAVFFIIMFLCVTGISYAEKVYNRKWDKLKDDGLHDPENNAIQLLQEPADSLSVLPPDTAGNQVNWVNALRDGYIKPRNHLNEQGDVKILDSSVLMKNTGEMPYVLFPHRAHTEWLDCGSCHDHLFLSRAGATKITMLSILQGQFCGRCHGAVSFPLTECDRCHSVKHDRFTR